MECKQMVTSNNVKVDENCEINGKQMQKTERDKPVSLHVVMEYGTSSTVRVTEQIIFLI